MTAYRALVEKKSAYSEKYKTYYDRGKKDIKFNSGDLVMVYWPEQKKGMSKKFLQKWRGPFKIMHQLTPVTYRVQKGTITMQIHVQRLKLYTPYEATELKMRQSRIQLDDEKVDTRHVKFSEPVEKN